MYSEDYSQPISEHLPLAPASEHVRHRTQVSEESPSEDLPEILLPSGTSVTKLSSNQLLAKQLKNMKIALSISIALAFLLACIGLIFAIMVERKLTSLQKEVSEAGGVPGPVGSPGIPGRDGTNGLPGGQKGEQGDPGPVGDIGFVGPIGRPGIPGRPGDSGPVGATGFVGAPGRSGPQGIPGLPGEKGDSGSIG